MVGFRSLKTLNEADLFLHFCFLKYDIVYHKKRALT